jgi:hypothetical protein
MVCW